MTLPPEQLEQALRQWRHTGVPVEDEATATARRERLVPQVRAALRNVAVARERAQRRRRWLLVGAAAAALGLVVPAGTAARAWLARGQAAPGLAASASAEAIEGQVVAIHDGREVTVGRGVAVPWQPHDTLRTGADGRARVQTASGVRIEASPTSEIALADATPGAERLTLVQGRVDVDVPALGAGQTFHVVTVDTIVTVQGTSSRVTASGLVGGATRVEVREGLAEVQVPGEVVRLSAGQVWSSTLDRAGLTAPPSGSVGPEPPGSAVLAPVPPPRRKPSSPASAGGGPEVTGPAPTASTSASQLAEQNALFQAALAARRRGDDAAAIASLDTLLTRYPQSPLAGQARAERLRAARNLDPSGAKKP